MNKTLIKFVSLLVSLALFATLAGCGETADVWSEWIDLVEASDENDASADDSDFVMTPDTGSSKTDSNSKKNNVGATFTITKNGKSNYKIVRSLSNEGEDQAQLIKKVVKATTKATLRMLLDTEENDGPEIIIGDTTRDESIAAAKELGKNEYIIKADKEGNVIIVATSVTALNMATNRFLNEFFGYDETATKFGTEKPIPSNLNIHESVFSQYKLTWNDEFEGNALDNNKWGFRALMSEQPNMRLYSDERAVQVSNGSLKLIAGRINDTTYYSNTALTTYNTMVFKYGLLEMRAKVPFGRPAFPSFWMQSSQYGASETSMNVMAEIDMFEHFATDKPYIQTGVHKWYRDGTGEHYVKSASAAGNSGNYQYFFNSFEEANDWHTYALWWTPEFLSFMVDGDVYYTINITDEIGDFGKRGDGMDCFRDYCHIIYNNYLYTEGASIVSKDDVGKCATPEDKFPIEYTIDYLRLYQLPGEGGIIYPSE